MMTPHPLIILPRLAVGDEVRIRAPHPLDHEKVYKAVRRLRDRLGLEFEYERKYGGPYTIVRRVG